MIPAASAPIPSIRNPLKIMLRPVKTEINAPTANRGDARTHLRLR